jgi:cell division protein FtsX
VDGVYTRLPLSSATDLIYTASNIVTLELAQRDTTLITVTQMLLLPCLTEGTYKTVSLVQTVYEDNVGRSFQLVSGVTNRTALQSNTKQKQVSSLATDFVTTVNLFNPVNK